MQLLIVFIELIEVLAWLIVPKVDLLVVLVQVRTLNHVVMVVSVHVWRSIRVDIHILKDLARHMGLDLPLIVRVYDCRRACLRVVIDFSVCPGICQREILVLSLGRVSFDFLLERRQTSSNIGCVLHCLSLGEFLRRDGHIGLSLLGSANDALNVISVVLVVQSSLGGDEGWLARRRILLMLFIRINHQLGSPASCLLFIYLIVHF